MSFREIWLSGTHVPVAWFLLAIIGTGFGIRWFYQRSYPEHPARHLWWLRFGAVALILLALADLTSRSFHIQLPELVIGFDQSTSMSLPMETAINQQGKPPTSRLQQIRSVISDERWAWLQQRYRLSFWSLGDSALPLSGLTSAGQIRESLRADQSQSRLGDGLQEILDYQAGKNTVAMVVFSDGAVTQGQSLVQAATAAARQAIPIYAVGFGSPLLAPNLALEAITADARVRQDQPLTISIDLAAQAMRQSDAKIMAIDKDTGEQFFSQEFPITSDAFRDSIPVKLQFDVPGQKELVIQVTSTIEESNRLDNQQELRIEVVEGKTRVLIVQDFPSPWFRILKETLSRAIDFESGQPAFAVKTVLQQASANFELIDPNTLSLFPVGEELDEYDLIIMGDARLDSIGLNRGLSAAECQALDAYVRNQAGNLVWVPGPRHIQQLVDHPLLSRLLPTLDGSMMDTLSNEAFQLEFQPANSPWDLFDWNPSPEVVDGGPGRFHIFPATTGSGPVSTIAQFRSENPRQSVQDLPAIVWQRIGSGTVMTHFSDELYKLRYRSQATTYEQYWTGMVRALAAERLQKRDLRALLQTDSTQYNTGQTVAITAEVFDPRFNPLNHPVLQIQILDESGDSSTVDMPRAVAGTSRYQTSFVASARGDYRLLLKAPGFDSDFAESRFVVRDSNMELRILNQQATALREMATLSAGVYLDANEEEKLWGRLPRGTWNQIGPAEQSPIWSRPIVPLLFALAVITLLVLEWGWRRKMQLE